MAAIDALAVLEVQPSETLERGDHTLIVGDVERAEVGKGEPLVYFEGEFRTLNPAG